jgi:hypothetical protein
MRRSVGIALQRDRRDADRWSGCESLFHCVILLLTLSQAEPPTVVVDHDIDVIWIVECRCAAIERSIVEVPARRSDPPDQLRKLTPILLVSGPPPVR